MIAVLLKQVTTFGRLIKFSHTIFALPFALASVVMASKYHAVTWPKVGWIVAAMVGARSAAMGFNRMVDVDIDRGNPRTAQREIPRGVITMPQAAVFVILSAALLVVAAYQLNALCFALSPLALVIVFFYSLTKRFTSFAHIFLGIALGVAPLGAWMAIAGAWNWSAFLLGASVLGWVAGFDIIYACQDVDYDRAKGLYSMPARWGVGIALWVSRTLHVLAVSGLVTVGVIHGLGTLYHSGLLVIGIVLVYEHHLVKPHDLSRVNVAFMNINGIISVVFFVATFLDIVWGPFS